MMNSSCSETEDWGSEKGGDGEEITKKNTDIPSTLSVQKRYVPKIIIPITCCN